MEQKRTDIVIELPEKKDKKWLEVDPSFSDVSENVWINSE